MTLSILLLITFLATTLAVVSQLLTGFGFALVLLPLLMLVISPAQAVGTTIVLGAILCIAMVWRDRHHVDRVKLMEMLVGSLVGLPLGIAIVALVPPPWLKWMVVGSVLAALLVVLVNLTIRNRRSTTAGVGLLSGVLLTSTGVNGPPLVALLRANNYPPSVYRATLAAIFTVQNGVGSLLLFGAGRVDATMMTMIGAGVLAMPAAYWLGERLFHRINAVQLRWGIIVMLVICLGTVLAFR